MPIYEEMLRPLAAHIAEALAHCTLRVGSSWNGYQARFGLQIDRREKDDDARYSRPGDFEGRLYLENVRLLDPDPSSLHFDDEIILGETARASDTILYTNDSDVEQTIELTHEFGNEKSELDSILAAVEVSSTTNVTVGGDAYGGSVSQEFSSTLKSEWQRQTGITTTDTVSLAFPVIVPPRTRVEGRLVWKEVEKQKRVRGQRVVDCKIVIGRRQRRDGKYRWVTGSPVEYDSIDQVLALLDGTAGPSTPLYHYRRADTNPVFAQRIRDARVRHFDTLTPPFKGANHIQPAVVQIPI